MPLIISKNIKLGIWMNHTNVIILHNSLARAARVPQDGTIASKLMDRLKMLPDFDNSNDTTNHFELFDSKTDSFLGTEVRWESEQIKEPYWRVIARGMDVSGVVKSMF